MIPLDLDHRELTWLEEIAVQQSTGQRMSMESIKEHVDRSAFGDFWSEQFEVDVAEALA